ncbi:hypothetical protein P154DRAFT_269974, partial [Amniculicola lignicola CBS 123094]
TIQAPRPRRKPDSGRLPPNSIQWPETVFTFSTSRWHSHWHSPSILPSRLPALFAPATCNVPCTFSRPFARLCHSFLIPPLLPPQISHVSLHPRLCHRRPWPFAFPHPRAAKSVVLDGLQCALALWHHGETWRDMERPGRCSGSLRAALLPGSLVRLISLQPDLLLLVPRASIVPFRYASVAGSSAARRGQQRGRPAAGVQRRRVIAAWDCTCVQCAVLAPRPGPQARC